MKWASGISEQTSLAGAVEECTAQVRQQLGDANPDLAVVFVSTHYQRQIVTDVVAEQDHIQYLGQRRPGGT